ncbi:MAG: sugar phosphate isomerase/epimerase family protein [Armatimonadota bacterium]|jgi:sugar phosphate isomerase/epimerase
MSFSKYSVREPVYRGWENAVKLLPETSIKGFEVSVRPHDELADIVAALREVGIEPMTVAGGVKLNDEASIAAYIGGLDAAQALGIPIFFTSASGEEDLDAAMGLLRDLAEEAARRGIVISLETHPPYCENADLMLRTMEAVDHPNLRVNFDTANIFFYNEGLDSADELERVIDYVVSVHLKDTDGGFKSGRFPVLGLGVVQFERIFGTLEAAGFDGPLTLELEGELMRDLDAQGRHQAVIECMDYLRSIGVA